MALCKVNGCVNPRKDRGICSGHLVAFGQQVDLGEASWEDYEKIGVCIPEKPLAKTCVTQGCGIKANARGLCLTCYAAALRLMKVKGIQWYDLEKLGVSLPGRVKRSEGPSLFRINAERLMAEERKAFATAIESAPPEQTIPVTQDQPLPPFMTEEEIDSQDGPPSNLIPVSEQAAKVPLRYGPELEFYADENGQRHHRSVTQSDVLIPIQPGSPASSFLGLENPVDSPSVDYDPDIPGLPDKEKPLAADEAAKVPPELPSFPAPPTQIPGQEG